MRFALNCLAAGLLVAAAGSAWAQYKPEQAIKYRQAAYGFAAWNYMKLHTLLDARELNREEAVKAAVALQGVANSGMGALYGPGTEKGVGFKETRVKPELFADREGVAKVAQAFIKEANELARLAPAGDAAALKAQLGRVGETCKVCHDKYRGDDKR